jgi:hypothetical protein
VWGTLVQARVPPDRCGPRALAGLVRVDRPDPVSFAVTGAVSKAIGDDTTLVITGIVPAIATASLFFVARLRRDEDGKPLLGDYAVAGSSAAATGSETPAIS